MSATLAVLLEALVGLPLLTVAAIWLVLDEGGSDALSIPDPEIDAGGES